MHVSMPCRQQKASHNNMEVVGIEESSQLVRAAGLIKAADESCIMQRAEQQGGAQVGSP